MPRHKSRPNKSVKDEHGYLPIGDCPPMQFPQDGIEENRLGIGKQYLDAETAAVDARVWRELNLLGQNIKSARERAGYTQGKLAQALGVSVRTMKRYENGSGIPDASQLRIISIACGVPTDWLLGLIGSEAARLLELYDYSTKTQRKYLLEAAKQIQGATLPNSARWAEADRQDFMQHLRERSKEREEG